MEGPKSSFYWSCRKIQVMVVGKSCWEGGMGMLVKEELCKSVVAIHRRKDSMRTMCLIFGENDMDDMCLCTSK